MHVQIDCDGGLGVIALQHCLNFMAAMLFCRLKSCLRRVCKPREFDSRELQLAIYREKDIFERRNAANEAKKALLERFKARPTEDDPAVVARKAERQAILAARAERDAEKAKLKQERLAREAAERAAREAAAEQARLEAEAKAAEESKLRESEENERIARLLADEAERKAKRDARYAARKARVGRTPPGFVAR